MREGGGMEERKEINKGRKGGRDQGYIKEGGREEERRMYIPICVCLYRYTEKGKGTR